jgi:FecR protein
VTALGRLLVLVIILLGAGSPASALDLAGSIERLQGSAVATGTTGFSRPLQPGSTILVGDRLTTASNSRLLLRFHDGASVTLGSNSTMTVETYDEDPAQGRSIIGIAEGVFLAASGAIARLGQDRFTINTPSATLGVRGTEVWGDQLPDRLAVTLLSGAGVVVITPLGSIEMTEPESGIDIVAGQPLPEPKRWGAERLERARQAVAFD